MKLKLLTFFTINKLALLAVFLTIFTISILPSNVRAQACETGGSYLRDQLNQINKCAIEKDIFDDKLFNSNQMVGTVDSLNMMLAGGSSLHPETNQITQNSGALASAGKMITALYSSPPASGIQFFAGEFRKINPVQPAYAQTDIGYNLLSPAKTIWQVFRNLSYIAFVVVFVIIGFMIMFRARISPQTVASVQDSVPRLVVALILVTFSYAIAGLMIDAMFVLLNVLIQFLHTSKIIGDNYNYVFEKNIFDVVTGNIDNIFKAVANAISEVISDQVRLPFELQNVFLTGVGGLIAGVIVGIAMLFIMFRIFLMLLMSYVTILILTFVSPFFFLIQALPGNNGAKEWFKQLAGNIVVFPTVALLFIFAGVLGGIESLGGTATPALDAGEIGPWPLLSAGMDSSTVGALIAIGMLLTIPEITNMVKNFITGGRGGGGGGGIGAGAAAALGAGAGVLGAGLRMGGRQVSQSSPARALQVAGEQRSTNSAQNWVRRMPQWMRGGSQSSPVVQNRPR